MNLIHRCLTLFTLLAAILVVLLPTTVAAMEPPQQGTTEYVVQGGDTLSAIAKRFGVTTSSLVEANKLENPNLIRPGQRLVIPGASGATARPASPPAAPAAESTDDALLARMTPYTRRAPRSSPLRDTTWVTYYGRPGIPVMGILGEYDLDGLVPRLQEQAAAYDEANGPELDVMPALHLIYGMATKAPRTDGSHLAYLGDEVVMEYINRAQEEGFGVILDVQVGALSPLAAMEVAFPYLQYDNVHLALDPEFRMAEPDQQWPGRPPGYVTAEEINAVQRAMRDYMEANDIAGRRLLVVHQFLSSMIVNKSAIEDVAEVDLIITADGFGGPWAKVSKYNSFITDGVEAAGFKLFYQWDNPLLTEREALGVEPHGAVPRIETPPNLIIYQ